MSFEKREIKVYIASPYTNGWMPTNVKRQFDISGKLMELGYWPYVPLLTHFLELYTHYPEHKWLELDFVYLKTCNALLRIKPIDESGREISSKGADQEESLARKEGIPVFYNIEDLNDHFKTNSSQTRLY